MKKIVNINNTLLLLIAILAWGCGDDAKNDAIESNVAYIQGAYQKKYTELYVEDDVPTSMTVPLSLTHTNEEKEIKIKMDISPEALEAYNTRYNKNYKLYPEDKRKFLQNEITIKKGAASSYAKLEISPFTAELKETGDIYAVPVVITEVDGAGIMQGADTYVYVLRQVPIATVGSVRDGAGYMRFKMEEEYYEFTALTAEFMFCVQEFKKANNHVMFYNNVDGRNDGSIFTRLENGANGIENSEMQFSVGDDIWISGTPGGAKFEVGKWYHVAGVFANQRIYLYVNGILVGKKDIARNHIKMYTQVESRWAGFCFGGGGIGLTKVAEVRLWNVARTPDQIKENMYRVNPASEGLLGYWKIDEGSGYEFTDYTGNSTEKGFIDNKREPEWYTNQRLNVE